jgi:hypothetical protein
MRIVMPMMSRTIAPTMMLLALAVDAASLTVFLATKKDTPVVQDSVSMKSVDLLATPLMPWWMAPMPRKNTPNRLITLWKHSLLWILLCNGMSIVTITPPQRSIAQMWVPLARATDAVSLPVFSAVMVVLVVQGAVSMGSVSGQHSLRAISQLLHLWKHSLLWILRCNGMSIVTITPPQPSIAQMWVPLARATDAVSLAVFSAVMVVLVVQGTVSMGSASGQHSLRAISQLLH